MDSLNESTLPQVYDSYESIAPAKYAGKLNGKVVSSSIQTISSISP